MHRPFTDEEFKLGCKYLSIKMNVPIHFCSVVKKFYIADSSGEYYQYLGVVSKCAYFSPLWSDEELSYILL